MKRNMLLIVAVALLCAAPAFGALGLDYHGGLGAEGGDCAACHNNSPAAAMRGWSMDFTITGNNWYNQPIAKLCWTCHNSGSIYATASDQDARAFSNLSHQYGNISVPNSPAAWAGAGAEDYSGTSLPYVNSVGGLIDCTSCHNVHNNLARPFSMLGTGNDFSALCKRCHTDRENIATAASVGANNSFAIGAYNVSLHPTDVAISDATGGVSGFVVNPAFTTAIGANWVLGGKLTDAAGTGDMSCQTCHRVHGPFTLGTNEDLLTIYNETSTRGASALCKACHTGGDVGEEVGTGTDHPIDSLAGQPWYPPASAYTLNGAANGVPGVWIGDSPHGDTGATSYIPTTSTTVRAPSCSSCHDTHGGLAGTALQYAPIPAGAGTDWCFSCHSADGIVPEYHHSVFGNWASSQLTCGDCHGTGDGTWNAHNGFWGFRGETISATNSDFCEACHMASDPTNFVAGSDLGAPGTWTNAAGDFPASHGSATGSATHIVNAAPTGINNVITDVGFDWAGGFTYTPSSFYGTAVSQYGAGGVMLCESCHNILTNAGSLTTGTVVTGGWQANLLLAPYEDDGIGNRAGAAEAANDFFAGPTGDAFCRVCHNSDGGTVGVASATATSYVHYPAAHTVRAFNYAALGVTPYNRTISTVLTGGVCADAGGSTTADAAAAPGDFSYPDDDTLDCDSCHRPHDANTVGTALGGGETSQVIVQSLTVETNGKSAPCAECHDTNVMCGY